MKQKKTLTLLFSDATHPKVCLRNEYDFGPNYNPPISAISPISAVSNPILKL